MPIQILMPALSPTMTEGNLAKWLKNEGDKIKAGEVIAEIETDKAVMEVEAVDEGVLAKIVVPGGTENVKVNELIALILEEGEDKSSLASMLSNNNSKPAAANIDNTKAQEPKAQPTKTETKARNNAERIFASPLAKRIAENENINLTNITGSGPHGRIVKNDVINSSAKQPAKSSASMATNLTRNPDEYTKIPNNNMRKVIAKRLCESKQTVPHFYLSVECQTDKLLSFRQDLNAVTNPDKPEYKISVNDLVIKAVAMALREAPEANGSWTDEAILRYNNIDISVAVAIDGGLITPIIRNADMKSIPAISNQMKDLAARAKAGKLAPEEFQGGGFSISNLGMYGIKNFNAIINPPQSCILAIGTGIERPVFENGAIKAATIMEVTLSCDHRVVDGAVGAQFLTVFKKFIEHPVRMII